ncbi:MAG: hypothetical protein M1814_001890 [Vezdaea aestivalis]|nr:MAG: hypothetical protein M1814_001890 [Vezdaea aestivalis]
MALGPVLRRALLYVPASSPRMLQKSRTLNVDTLAYDLEDSVAIAQKADARSNLKRFLTSGPRPYGSREIAVRINSPSSGFAIEDLSTVSDLPHVDTVVIPKVSGPSDIHFVIDALKKKQDRSPSTRILVLIESAEAVQALPSICKASPLLSGLIFAAEDFALDLSLTRTPGLNEFLYARSAIVTAAVAAKVPSIIDLVHTSYGNVEALDSLRDESLGGKGLGFNGKQVIHPSQVDTVQEAFSPGKSELMWAARIMVANEKAEAMGKGAWGLDGKMIDVPVVGKAKSILTRASLCGIHVDEVKAMWKFQEPE